MAKAPEELQLAALGTAKELGPEFIILMDGVFNEYRALLQEKTEKEAKKKREREEKVKRRKAKAKRRPMRG